MRAPKIARNSKKKALPKVKHSCSEVSRALTLRLGGRSGIDRKKVPSYLESLRPPGARAPLRAARGFRRFEVTSHKQCCDFGIGPTLDHAVQGRSNVAQRGPRSPILWRARVVQGQFWKGWTWSKVGSSVIFGQLRPGGVKGGYATTYCGCLAAPIGVLCLVVYRVDLLRRSVWSASVAGAVECRFGSRFGEGRIGRPRLEI